MKRNTLNNVTGVLSIREAADALGVSYSRAYDLVKAGRLKATGTFAGSIKIDRESVATFKRRKPGRPRSDGRPATR